MQEQLPRCPWVSWRLAKGRVDLSPGVREIHGRISLVLQAQKAGARRKMRGSVLYSTLSPFFERNAVDAGR